MSCFHPLTIKNKSGVYTVPCGKCPECLRQKRANWVIRNLITFSHCTNPSYFVTLTYDETNCPEQVSKRDLQLFFKRFRKSLGDSKIKYFACGEYGSRNSRPHYHAILYNVPLCIQEMNDIVKRCWQVGYVTVAQPNVARIKYTTKYVMKATGKDNPLKPFLLCSKGLGAEIVEDSAVVAHVKNSKNTVVHYGGLSYNLPKYTLSKILTDEELVAVQEEKQKFLNEKKEEAIRHHIRGDRHYFDLIDSHEEFMKLQISKTKHNEQI